MGPRERSSDVNQPKRPATPTQREKVKLSVVKVILFLLVGAGVLSVLVFGACLLVLSR
jgi:hypothetical protein